MYRITLNLSEVHKSFIIEHMNSSPQHEVCGLVGGVWQERLVTAHQVIAVRNISPEARLRYFMEPQGQIKALMEFEKNGLEMIGIYHSHPQGRAIPSPTDIAEALYPDVVYLIGVPGINELCAWRIVRGLVQPVVINPDEPDSPQ